MYVCSIVWELFRQSVASVVTYRQSSATCCCQCRRHCHVPET